MAKTSAASQPDVVALAKKYLRGKQDVCEEIAAREFWDDTEAHDEELVEKTHRQFLRKMKAYQKLLSEEFGQPAELGQDEHDASPATASWKTPSETSGASRCSSPSHTRNRNSAA